HDEQQQVKLHNLNVGERSEYIRHHKNASFYIFQGRSRGSTFSAAASKCGTQPGAGAKWNYGDEDPGSMEVDRCLHRLMFAWEAMPWGLTSVAKPALLGT
ncbi:hypothetical protein KC19_VG039100, partial [Ceratodon purpureus]